MKDTKTELVGFKATPELKKQIENAAKKENRSVSSFLTNLILQAIKE